MGIINKLFGIEAKPAQVSVISAPARVSRDRMVERRKRIETSIKKLRASKKAPEKLARLEAELRFLHQELGR